MSATASPWAEGRPDAEIVFIAEAPARWEMLEGRPLVGPSGRVFNECLHRAGLTRAECGIQNLIRHRIDDISEYVGKKGLTSKGLEARDDLIVRLHALKPKVLVPMGNPALCALTDLQAITKRRGSPHSSTIQGLEDIPIIPTMHPASTLPGRGDFVDRYVITWDMEKAARFARGARPPAREILIRPTKAQALEFLRLCGEAPRLGFDIEIYNRHVSCISFAPTTKLCMSIPFVGESHGPYWPEQDEAEIWLAIQDLLGDPRVAKVAHNAMFDVSFLALANRIRVRGEIHCSMTLHRVLYPDFPSRLEFVSSVWTDEPYYKDDRQLWKKLDDLDRFFTYNAKDSLVCLEAFGSMEEELLASQEDLDTYQKTMQNFDPCLFAMLRGLRVDMEDLERTKKELESEMSRKVAELSALGANFNPLSPKQCIAYFYGTKGIKPYINRKTRAPTCDDIALSRIYRRFHLPEAKLAQEIRSLRKLLGTYMELELDDDQRLRCFYNIRGATTGRFSSSQTILDTGLNLQNLDPRFKYFIVPD